MGRSGDSDRLAAVSAIQLHKIPTADHLGRFPRLESSSPPSKDRQVSVAQSAMLVRQLARQSLADLEYPHPNQMQFF